MIATLLYIDSPGVQNFGRKEMRKKRVLRWMIVNGKNVNFALVVVRCKVWFYTLAKNNYCIWNEVNIGNVRNVRHMKILWILLLDDVCNTGIVIIRRAIISLYQGCINKNLTATYLFGLGKLAMWHTVLYGRLVFIYNMNWLSIFS